MLGIILGVFGLIFRFTLQETEQFLEVESMEKISKNPLVEAMRTSKLDMGYMVGFLIFGTVSFYILTVYTFIFMQKVGGLSLQTALAITSAAMIVELIMLPVVGWLVDRYIGVKPVLLTGAIACGLLAPFLFSILATGNVGLSVFAIILFALFATLYHGPVIGLVGSMLPVQIRTSGLAMGYNFTVALFGGTAPLVSALLINWTGNSISPAYYLSFIALISFLTLLFYPFPKSEK